MTSVGRRLQALNFRGRTGKGKKGDRDELDLDHNAYVALRKSSVGNLPTMGLGKPTKSNSLGSISAEVDGALDQDDIVTLTQDVRCFSDSLSQLKTVFTETDEDAGSGHSIHVQAHKELGDVLYSLRTVLNKYPALHTTDVLTAAAVLITKVKSANYEELAAEVNDLHFSIDQLALAFSSSVSEYLMGDVDAYPSIGKSKSFDNLHGADSSDFGSTDNLVARDGLSWNADDLDSTLMKFEDGVDLALSRAKAWAKYAKDVATYVEKRAQMELEFAKNLSKLATGVRQTITDDSYLPFQSIYCTALDHDRELASTTQTCCSLLQQEKFVEPLLQRRLEHERSRKTIKDWWTRELRKMHEAVGNMRKAKALYVQRQLDYDKAVKARDQATTRAEQDLSASSSSVTAKADKKRKLEEEAMHRAIEAETTYKACVIEANNRQQDLEKIKGEVLVQIREIIMESELTMKSVTVGYFKLQHAVMAPLPVQYQTLYESCEQYDPGAQYAEYVRHLPVATVHTPEPFTFEAFTAESKLYERKPSTQSSGSGSSDIQGFGEDSPSPGRHGEKSRLLKGWGHGGSDSDSISGSSCKSRESSPSASPYPRHRTNLITSSSMNELAEADRDAQYDSRTLPTLGEIGHGAFRTTNMSRAARTHHFRKLRTPSRCRHCESYVYFQGAECDKCGISSHKKCLESLLVECGHNTDVSQEQKSRRMTTFGVDLNAHVGETDSLIPNVIRRCAGEIDDRGLHVKGIYRVSGVKSKVERLCQTFETNEGEVDLSEHPPVVIANVLKLYLRQLPEPLLSFQLYPDFMRVAKEESENPEEMVERLKALAAQLPAANFNTCAMLMHHLYRVSEEREINQMTAGNLGIVFGPTLLRPSEGAASLNSLMDTPLQTRIVEVLIDKVVEIFGAEVKPEVEEEDKSTPVREISEENDTASEDQQDVHSSFEDIGLDKADVKCSLGALASSTIWCLVTDTLPRSKPRHRYIPESTENLMEELAKEDHQLFQQVREDYVNLPGSTDATDGKTDANRTPTICEGGVTPEDSDEALPEIPLPDCSTSQPLLVPSPSELMKGASHLPVISMSAPDGNTRQLHASTSTPTLQSSASSDSGSVKSLNLSVSPGLRRRLKASDLRTRSASNTVGGSTFYSAPEAKVADADTGHQVPTLSQPRSFTPPLLGGNGDSGSDNQSSSRSVFYAPSPVGSQGGSIEASSDTQSIQSDSQVEEREPQYV